MRSVLVDSRPVFRPNNFTIAITFLEFAKRRSSTHDLNHLTLLLSERTNLTLSWTCAEVSSDRRQNSAHCSLDAYLTLHCASKTQALPRILFKLLRLTAAIVCVEAKPLSSACLKQDHPGSRLSILVAVASVMASGKCIPWRRRLEPALKLTDWIWINGRFVERVFFWIFFICQETPRWCTDSAAMRNSSATGIVLKVVRWTVTRTKCAVQSSRLFLASYFEVQAHDDCPILPTNTETSSRSSNFAAGGSHIRGEPEVANIQRFKHHTVR